MTKLHHYHIKIQWTGNEGSGTKSYRSYSRNHIISVEGKADIAASSDPAFRGNRERYNPEEMFVASLSSCHMLWYLHLCSEEGVVVVGYTDNAQGTMTEDDDGGGRFSEVMLNPVVTVADESMTAKANELHKRANNLCFIANSCNFPVRHNVKCLAG